MGQQQIRGATGDLGSNGSLDVYDVPGSVIVTPYSVSATFDGSGAAGSFLPCLTFKTQTGAIIARCPAPEVAAGDTAEVSWFPGGGVSGGAAAASGAWTFAYIPSATTYTVAAQSGGSPTTQPLGGDVTSFYTNAPSVFTTASATIGGNPYVGVAVSAAGHYLIKTQVALNAIGGTGEISAVFLNAGDATPAEYGSEGRVWTRQTGDSTQDGWYLEALVTAAGSDSFPDGPFLFQVSNGTNNTLQTFGDVMCVQLDTDSTRLF